MQIQIEASRLLVPFKRAKIEVIFLYSNAGSQSPRRSERLNTQGNTQKLKSITQPCEGNNPRNCKSWQMTHVIKTW